MQASNARERAASASAKTTRGQAIIHRFAIGLSRRKSPHPVAAKGIWGGVCAPYRASPARARARAEAANDMRSRRQLVSFTASACAAACAHSARAVERSRAAELSEDTSRSLGTPSLWLA